MQTLALKIRIDPDGHLRLDIPTNLPVGEVDLLVVIDTANAATSGPYDFRDLTGRLRWSGDALQAQQNLRNEWPD